MRHRNLLLSMAGGLLVLTLGGGVVSAQPEPTDQERRESALAAIQESRFEDAVRDLETLTRSGVEDVELYYWLGYASWEMKSEEQAILAYGRGIDLDQAQQSLWSLYALENLAEVYGRTDRLLESEASYRVALRREMRPEWRLKIQTQLAELALTMGTFVPDERTILNSRGEVIGGVGPNAMRTNRHFEIARHTQDPHKQEEHYRKSIDMDPTMYQSYFNLGLALVEQEKYAEAVSWFLESDAVYKSDRDVNPAGRDKADAHAFLSLCYLELSELSKAQDHAALSHSVDPDYYWGNLFAERIRVAVEDQKTSR